LDVLGIALVAANEIVKMSGSLSLKMSGSFDYDENRKDIMYTEKKSSLISVGFQNTEIVPYNSTPLPDDHNPATSLTARYGGTTPQAQIINPDDEAVCVKTTKWVLKQLTHLSPALKVNGHVLPNTSTSLAGVKYHEKARETMENAVKVFYEVKAIQKKIDIGVQCNLQDSISQNKDLQLLCIEMVKNVLNLYTKRINSDNRDKDYNVKMQSTLEMLKDTLSSENLNSTTSDDLSGTTSTDYILIPKCKENSMNNNNDVSEINVPPEVTDCVGSESSYTASAKFKKITQEST